MGDREWAQPDLFLNLAWNDISSACPANECAGVLNGYDMTGWTWASPADVYGLYNEYLGPGTITSYPVIYSEPGDCFSPALKVLTDSPRWLRI